jgi:hypothetical protein
MTYHVKVGGVWKTTTANYVKVSGTWRTVSQMWIKVSGTWSQLFTTVRAFTTLSSNYPDNKGAVTLGVIGTTLLRFSGESPFTNLAYKCDTDTNTTTWTQVTNYPTSTQGAFGGVIGSTIWGMAGYPATTSVYGTSNLGSSWTTGASCSSSYWHVTTANGCSQLSGAILKAGGFNSDTQSFDGSSWTTRTSQGGLGFGMLVDTPSRTYYTGGPGSESNQTTVRSTVGGASWTVETSQPVATRRTYGSYLDGKILQLGGEAVSNVYEYSGTGGTWAARIAIGYGSTYTSYDISGKATYGTGFNTTWKYA